ncbi:hypothetical protein SERLADRAFT_473364 [Serpula lacrymans var. lacrymans S7.9]|uniref:Anaphase-promoting complex subunit 4 WD40 domain-containing protein n=1 Tax=Serpula lacrymans var. lacrymans (strain S7.9) TaxID=578457 RepID=F8P2U4_SERL9|nr:uncharacterized protein SERLADRAFT_473364 [Serpula lacrymans var. lacrymans S7.9]EGO22479.1 hypothetical protein SERLADRAFT_473364 [Serpula lacrymans var. lacrymans S7.9]
MNVDDNDRGETFAVISPDGTRMLLSKGTSAELWDIENHQKLLTQLGRSYRGEPLVAFSPDGKYIASSIPYDQKVTFYDALTGAILCKHEIDGNLEITSLSISKDSARILISFDTGNTVIGHIAEPYTSMHVVDTIPPVHTMVQPWRQVSPWFEDKRKNLLYFPETVERLWARMGSNLRGLILELKTGEVALTGGRVTYSM